MERPAAIGLADIRIAFTGRDFEKGRLYARSGRVHSVTVSADGMVVHGKVQGSEHAPYRQAIAISRDRVGRAVISGTCSCPVGHNCKHVVAVLLVAREPAGVDATPASRPPAPEQMPWQVTAWLNSLGGETAANTNQGGPRQRLFYIAEIDREPRQPRDLVLRPVVVNVLKNGEYSDKIRTYNIQPALLNGNVSPPAFVHEADRPILRRLARLAFATGEEAEETVAEVIDRVCASGQGRWAELRGPVLRRGAARMGRTVWLTDQSGAQRPTVQLAEGLQLMRLPEPWYADPASGEIGPLDLDMPRPVAAALLQAPAVPYAHAAKVRAEIRRRFPTLALPSPAELQSAIAVEGPPRPRLLLQEGTLPGVSADLSRGAYYMRTYTQPVRGPLAVLGFRYGPLLRPPGAPAATQMHEGTLYTVAPNRAAEVAALQLLDEWSLVEVAAHFEGVAALAPAGAHFFPGDAHDAEEAWIDLLLDGVPALRAAGWEVEIAPDFPVRLAMATSELNAAIKEGSGIDWFELDLGIEVDGARVDLAPALIDLLSRPAAMARVLAALPEDAATERVVLRLADGRQLPLPASLVQPILAALLELFGDRPPSEGKLAFNRLDAADLAALEAASAAMGVVWTGGEAVRALGRLLRGGAGIPRASIPADFGATLRDYQARGVDWLQFLREAGLGGVLADDMGLGKTVQTLAHLAIEKAEGRLDRPALIVCPTSLVPNWTLEAARFAPTLRVLPLHGPQRRERFGEIAAHDLVITTYPLLSRDQEALAAQPWHVLVLDEAQTIKNPDAGATRLVRSLDARQRLALSGTPLENHLGELWSLFHFLSPGFLGERATFQRDYRTPIEKGGDEAKRARLVRRVQPFLLRRTKQEVASDLPPKTEIVEAIEMAAPQRAIYESIRLAMHARVRAAIAERGLARSGIIMLDALLKLRQACCDPRLLKLKSAKTAEMRSAKLERLLEMVPQLLDEGRKILLFSQFTSMLALIEQALDAQRIPYAILTGDTTDRRTPVKRFQAGEVKLFLISLKAGGVGLNLTAADTVIHYDPWWNPAVEDQATDRAHRIGQTQSVFVHKMMVLGTIEEKMEELKLRKRTLVDSILTGAGAKALSLTERDVDELFAP